MSKTDSTMSKKFDPNVPLFTATRRFVEVDVKDGMKLRKLQVNVDVKGGINSERGAGKHKRRSSSRKRRSFASQMLRVGIKFGDVDYDTLDEQLHVDGRKTIGRHHAPKYALS